MMCNMDRNWARLGTALKAARVAQGLEQQQAAEAIGVKRGALHNIERGGIAKLTPTIRTYARLVGWTDDSPERVLAGEEPVLREPEPSNAIPADQLPESISAPDLSLRIRQALQEGPLLDSQVFTVPTPGGDVLATIVVRGKPTSSPEDLQKALLAWREREPELQRLKDSDDAPDSTD